MRSTLFAPKRLRAGIALAVVALLGSCVHAPPTRLRPQEMQAMAPQEFVSVLRRLEQGWLTVEASVQEWPPRESLAFLVSLLDDASPSPMVIVSRSSHLGSGRSTIGHEAAYLLLGMQQGRYPPRMNSSQMRADERDAVEAWARRRLELDAVRGGGPGAPLRAPGAGW